MLFLLKKLYIYNKISAEYIFLEIEKIRILNFIKKIIQNDFYQ